MLGTLRIALVVVVIAGELAFLVGNASADTNTDGQASTLGTIGFWTVLAAGIPLVLGLVISGLLD